MKEPVRFPHVFSLKTSEHLKILGWCRDQKMKIFRDFLIVRAGNQMTLSFKDGKHAMLYKLVHV